MSYLVTFSGVDGSGKTEQIKQFTAYAKKIGLRYKQIHIIQNSIANKIRLSKRQKNNPTELRPVTHANTIGLLLRKIVLLCDIVLFRLSRFFFDRKSIDIVICDRYFYDYLVNIYYLEQEDNPKVPPFLLHLIPRPDLAILLKTDHETAFKRKQDRDTKYLNEKIVLFDRLKHQFNMREFESDTIENIANQITSSFEMTTKHNKQR